MSVAAVGVVRLGGPERASHEVWHRLPVVLERDRVAGYLCSSCHQVWDGLRSFGPTLAERSYLAHLHRLGRREEADR